MQLLYIIGFASVAWKRRSIQLCTTRPPDPPDHLGPAHTEPQIRPRRQTRQGGTPRAQDRLSISPRQRNTKGWCILDIYKNTTHFDIHQTLAKKKLTSGVYRKPRAARQIWYTPAWDRNRAKLLSLSKSPDKGRTAIINFLACQSRRTCLINRPVASNWKGAV